MSKIQPFCYSLDGTVWKQQIDLNSGHLCVEVRNADEHWVKYYVFDLINESILDVYTPSIDPWWNGLWAFSSGCIFVHGYQDTQNPIIEHLECYNYISKNIAWTHHNVIPLTLTSHGVTCKNSTEEIFEIEIIELGNIVPNTSIISELTLPEQYVQDHPYFETVASLIKSINEHESVMSIEYLEWENGVAISYYIYTVDKLQNYLLVLDIDGNQVDSIILGTGLTGIGWDTFYRWNNRLITVKNKNQIIVIK